MLLKWKKSALILSFFAMFNMNQLLAAQQQIIPQQTPFTADEIKIIKNYLFKNITTTDNQFDKHDIKNPIHSIPGAVLASPSNKEGNFSQDYQFHWTRDAALTMDEVVYLYATSTDDEKAKLKPYLMNYVSFERKAQMQQSRKGEQTLGQPKFNIDGTVWEGKWMRPQNDGPALRAIAMVKIAKLFHKEDAQYVQQQILPLITTDLNYVVKEWNKTSFDLWEEVNDREHFFTKMVQRKALLVGANFFNEIGRTKQAEKYNDVANKVTDSLKKHWNENLGYITETINQQYVKGGGLNSAIILGVLHGELQDEEEDDPFALNNYRVMSSIYFIRNAFHGLYKININNPAQPPLLGRYPNDIYDGAKFAYGNPWILTTNALAQYYYSLAKLYVKQGQINISYNTLPFFQQLDNHLADKEEVILATDNPKRFNKIINMLVLEGDKLLQTTKRYSACYSDQSCYHFAEQIDRTTGKQTSAKDLTWGYTSVLTALQARAAIDKNA